MFQAPSSVKMYRSPQNLNLLLRNKVLFSALEIVIIIVFKLFTKLIKNQYKIAFSVLKVNDAGNNVV